jgi:hypothetical protein
MENGSIPRKDRITPDKDVEKTPNRWQAAAGTDEVCGASELSTHVQSSPGVSSEADDAGGLLPMQGLGAGTKLSAEDAKLQRESAKGPASASSGGCISECSRGLISKLFGKGCWQRHLGESSKAVADAAALADKDAQATRVVQSLAILHKQIWTVRHQEPRSFSPKAAPTNSLAQALEVLPAAKRAEELAAERLTSEHSEAQRRSAETVAACQEKIQESEARMQRVEEMYQQQVASEVSRNTILRGELDALRRELETREKEAKLAEEHKKNEMISIAQKNVLGMSVQDKEREIEGLKTQHRIMEVELQRSKEELEKAGTRNKILEEELRLLKERPPKASSKAGVSKRLNSGNILERHDLANRAAAGVEGTKPGDKEGRPTETEQRSTGSFWGCCSPAPQGPGKEVVDASAPRNPAKPQSSAAPVK